MHNRVDDGVIETGAPSGHRVGTGNTPHPLVSYPFPVILAKASCIRVRMQGVPQEGRARRPVSRSLKRTPYRPKKRVAVPPAGPVRVTLQERSLALQLRTRVAELP